MRNKCSGEKLVTVTDSKRHPRQKYPKIGSALFIFSAEGKVFKHLIVRSHFILVFINKSEIMT